MIGAVHTYAVLQAYKIGSNLSLSTVVGIDKNCIECGIFARLETHLTISFSPKNQLKRTGTAIIMLYIYLTKRNVDYFDL